MSPVRQVPKPRASGSPGPISREPLWIRAALAFSLLLAGVALAFRRLGDFDLPWHLAWGRVVVGTRSVPDTDPLAFTHRPVEYTEFVSDALLYLLVRAGGPLALQIAGALVVVATAWVLLRQSRDAGPVRYLVVALGLCAMNAWLIVRPATFSFLLLALELWLLEEHRRDPAGPRGRRALALLPPLMLLWANVHGFVVVGLAVALGHAGHRALARVASRALPRLLPPEDGEHLGPVAAAVAASFGAAMINTAGPKLLLGPLRAQGDLDQVTEWAKPDIAFLTRTEPLAGIFLLVALAALAFGREPDTRSRVPALFHLGLFALALLLGQSAVRLIPVAVILLTPWIARRASGWMPATRLVAGASAAGMFAVGPYLSLNTATSLGVGFEPAHFPEGAVRYIAEHRPAGRMWNFLPLGGYLAWRLHPEYEVFIDGRSGWVHAREVVDRAHASNFDPAAFAKLAGDFDMHFAVTGAREGEGFGLPLAKSPAWEMVHLDDVGAVYVRREGPNAGLASAGYRVLRHLTSPDSILRGAVAGRRAGDLAHDAELAVAQAPESPRAAFLLASAGIALRDRAVFERGSSRLRALAPGHPALAVLEDAFRAALGATSGATEGPAAPGQTPPTPDD